MKVILFTFLLFTIPFICHGLSTQCSTTNGKEMCSIMISGNEDIKRTELWGMLPESDKSSIQTIENQATSQQDKNAKISMYLSTQVSPSIIDQFVGKNMKRGQEQADTMVKQMNANMDQMNANMAAMNSEMTRQFQEGFPFNG